MSRNSSSPIMSRKNTIQPIEQHLHDRYCFDCHLQGDLIECSRCPRSYHSQCLRATTSPSRTFICPECRLERISLSNIETSIQAGRYTTEEFYQVLRHILDRLQNYPQAKVLSRSNMVSLGSMYLHNMVYPMDLDTIRRKIKEKKYQCLQAFLADFVWIFHTLIICLGNQNETTDLARTLLSLTRHDINEFQLCPQCYLRSIQSTSADWFIQPCFPPHTLCWAKMTTYQPWPGKLLRVVNDLADVRFFGDHDRAWIPLKQCFVLSKEYPSEKKHKSYRSFDRSLVELNSHIERLKERYGQFAYAPLRTPISKTKPFKFVPVIDDSNLPTYLDAVESMQRSSSPVMNEMRVSKGFKEPNNKRSADSASSTAKRACLSPIRIEDDLQSRVETTEQSSSIWTELERIDNNDHDLHSQPATLTRSTSPGDNKARIHALLKKYLDSPSFSVDPTPSNDERISFSPDRLERSPILPCTSLDESLATTLPSIPIRPLSTSPSTSTTFERAPSPTLNPTDFQPTVLHIESLHPEEFSRSQSEILTELLPKVVSVTSADPCPEEYASSTLPRFTPTRSSSVPRNEPKKNIWLSALSVTPDPLPVSIQVPIQLEDSILPSTLSANATFTHDVRMMIKTINDQCQHAMINFAEQINTYLDRCRLKHEQDLENLRRSYCLSLNALHTTATQRIREVHQLLELQYRAKLAEMQRRHQATFPNSSS